MRRCTNEHEGRGVVYVRKLPFQTVPSKNFQWKSLLVTSNEGFTSRRLGSFSAPFVIPPLIFGRARLCSSDTVRPEPVESSNVVPLGLLLPGASCRARRIIEVMRRNRSNASSRLFEVSRGRGMSEESWSR